MLENYTTPETTPLLPPPNPRAEESEDVTSTQAFREELKILTKSSIPVFGSQLLEYSLIMASVVSIGHISTTALAAVTLGTMTANVSGYTILQGLSAALDTILPPAWTSSDPRLVGLWTQRMAIVSGVSLIPMFCVWFNAESLLLLAKQDPEVARMAAVYLRWASLGLPAYAFNCISRRYFQCQGLFTVPTQIIIAVAPLNILLNYILVWSPPPIGLGFIGAPIATAISFNVISLLSLLYGVFVVPKTAWYPLSLSLSSSSLSSSTTVPSSRMRMRMFNFKGLGVLAKLGFAGVGQTASEWWAWELAGLAASLMGPVALATQSVLIVSSSCTYQAPYALSIATSIRIGNLLGEGNSKRAGLAAKTAMFMGLVISLLMSTLFLLFRTTWGTLFNNDPKVISLVSSILPLVALFQVFDGLSGVASGILRARGKQVLGAVLNLTGYYVFALPIGIILAFKLDMGLIGLWLGLTLALVYNTFWGSLVVLRTDWRREVRKAMDRLREGEGEGGRCRDRCRCGCRDGGDGGEQK